MVGSLILGLFKRYRWCPLYRFTSQRSDAYDVVTMLYSPYHEAIVYWAASDKSARRYPKIRTTDCRNEAQFAGVGKRKLRRGSTLHHMLQSLIHSAQTNRSLKRSEESQAKKKVSALRKYGANEDPHVAAKECFHSCGSDG